MNVEPNKPGAEQTDLEAAPVILEPSGAEEPTSAAKAPVKRRKITSQRSEQKRTKGRPALAEGERGKYRHLLLKESQVASIIRIKEKSILTRDQLTERRTIILNNQDAALYYWKLAYTYSFFLLKEKIKADLVFQTKNPDTKEITLRTVAEMSGIPYHNFKKMFMGRGNMANFETYTTFLYLNGITFQEIYLDAGVIERAYGFFTLLMDDNAKLELVEKLYY